MNRIGMLLGALLICSPIWSQELDSIPDTQIEPPMDVVERTQTPLTSTRRKLDGIAAVVGDYVILDSDVEKTMIDLKNQGASEEDITACGLLGKLMEDRMYAHQAIQDSLLVSDDRVNAQGDRQIQQLVQQLGSMQKVLEYYKKSTVEDFRQELYEINKLNMLANEMQQKIVGELKVTPEEVRQFFYGIPEDQRPVFGAELEIAQIVKEPEAPQEEIDKAINKLREIKGDVEDNGASFNVKAILHSQDPGSRSNGGLIPSVTRDGGYVEEFKDVAFSLREGQVSEPFKTIFGYHLMYVEKIRGQERDVRHILLIPEIPQSALDEAKKELDSIRQQIQDGKYSFAEAALNFSDEKETREDGGKLRNPINFDSKFELTNMDPTLYNQIRNLKDNEISYPILEPDPRGGAPKYKILQVTNRFDEHPADFAQDYLKIQRLALTEKQVKEIKKWMKEHIEETYISINGTYRDCEFSNNWLKE